jgi:hypothetical protein
MSQSAETNDADLLALGNASVAHRRVCCDSGAEERCCSGRIEVGRDAEDKVFFDYYTIRVATIGDAS